MRKAYIMMYFWMKPLMHISDHIRSNSTCFRVTLLALGQSHNCIPVSGVTMNVWENRLVPNPTLINKTWPNVYWKVARWGATHNSIVILVVQTPLHLHLQVNVLHARDQLLITIALRRSCHWFIVIGSLLLLFEINQLEVSNLAGIN